MFTSIGLSVHEVKMTRQRRYRTNATSLSQTDRANEGGSDGTVYTGPYPRQKGRRQQQKLSGGGVPPLLVWTAALILLAVGGYLAYRGYLERRISTPLPYPLVIEPQATDELYWGTYRPGHYFGLKARHARSPVFGLMWFTPATFQGGNLPLRHWCDQADDLDSYGWLEHDGRRFGVQQLVDKHIVLNTSFVKRPHAQYGGDWTARFSVAPKTEKLRGLQVSLLFYVALDDRALSSDQLIADASGDTLRRIEGSTEALGKFAVTFAPISGVLHRQFFLSTRAASLKDIGDVTFRGFRMVRSGDERFIGLAGEWFDKSAADGADDSRRPNLVVYQVVGSAPFELEVVYHNKQLPVEFGPPLTSGHYDTSLAHLRHQFAERFDQQFPLAERGFGDQQHLIFARAALSNMVGGLGYFYGQSQVQSPHNSEPVPYWPAALFTAVPSRSFFPRGFLWDEGFHLLLVSRWDESLALQIVGHWLDLLNADGWIPREQILGSEAAARVPAQFLVQRSSSANPPTLMLTLHAIVQRTVASGAGLSREQTDFFRRAWPRLEAWYDWFNRTQIGEEGSTYRWRGRDENAADELNAKTLTSGLDDYPRASHPSSAERHLDLRCWMALASRLMADIGSVLSAPTALIYAETADRLSDPQILDSLHWSHSASGFMDYGLHSDRVKLHRTQVQISQNMPPQTVMLRQVLEPPSVRHVNQHGYVSLFPLLLQLLSADNPRLAAVLDSMEDRNKLWTDYGLRSLAADAPLYMRRNTEHDPPYWRGPIWINMNFLAVRALAFYSRQSGPQQERARQMHQKLRANVIKNLVREYLRTGYIWEQYNDSTGRGQGCRPFTGWSALVVLIMADSY